MPNTIFVNSLVNSPMPQTYASGVRVTVLQTLMAAGGVRTDAFPTECSCSPLLTPPLYARLGAYGWFSVKKVSTSVVSHK